MQVFSWNLFADQVDAALRSHAIESGVVLEHASHFVVFLERMPMTSMHQCLNLSPGLLNQVSDLTKFSSFLLFRFNETDLDRVFLLFGETRTTRRHVCTFCTNCSAPSRSCRSVR